MSIDTIRKVRICECYLTLQESKSLEHKEGGLRPLFSFFVFISLTCCLDIRSKLCFCLINDLITVVIKRLTDMSELRHLKFRHTHCHLNLDDIAIAILIDRNSHEEKNLLHSNNLDANQLLDMHREALQA